MAIFFFFLIKPKQTAYIQKENPCMIKETFPFVFLHILQYISVQFLESHLVVASFQPAFTLKSLQKVPGISRQDRQDENNVSVCVD